MKVSVFGLGYVGCVSAACLAKCGLRVIGVDVVDDKVQAIAAGRATVVEPEVDVLLAEAHRDGRITATLDGRAAVVDSEASLICVGTPSGRDGGLELSAVQSTAATIGEALRHKASRAGHLVVVRSTVPPGTVERIVLAEINRYIDAAGENVSVVIAPEFLRESSAVRDYFDPPLSVIGTRDGRPDFHQGLLASLLAVEPEQIAWTSYREAEILKSLCNAFHALKVAFANEAGATCDELGIDGRRVMQLLTMDRKLNISPAYLRPGMPYGGSCLPKDLQALVSLARKACVATPLLEAVSDSNETQKQRIYQRLLAAGGRRRVGMDALAFKSGTDDLRESPMVAIAEFLIGKGYDLRIYDPAVDSARLTGANRRFIQQHIPHLAERLVASPYELLDHAEVLVLTGEDDDLLRRATRQSDPPLVIDVSGAGRTAPGRRPPPCTETLTPKTMV